MILIPGYRMPISSSFYGGIVWNLTKISPYLKDLRTWIFLAGNLDDTVNFEYDKQGQGILIHRIGR